MGMLHTINKSPFERRSLESCLGRAKKGSSILFIEDGVYAVLKNTVVQAKITAAQGDFQLYVLEPDLQARGMTADQLIDGVQAIDYGGFVDLVAEHDSVNAWL